VSEFRLCGYRGTACARRRERETIGINLVQICNTYNAEIGKELTAAVERMKGGAWKASAS